MEINNLLQDDKKMGELFMMNYLDAQENLNRSVCLSNSFSN